jgi:hypothetical protein
MRTTINIDDDLLDRAKRIAEKRDKPLRYVINESLREGLTVAEQPSESKEYRMPTRNMNLKPGYDLDDVRELLSRLEGEDSR